MAEKKISLARLSSARMIVKFVSTQGCVNLLGSMVPKEIVQEVAIHGSLAFGSAFNGKRIFSNSDPKKPIASEQNCNGLFMFLKGFNSKTCDGTGLIVPDSNAPHAVRRGTDDDPAPTMVDSAWPSCLMVS
jgi:hypothetical protein